MQNGNIEWAATDPATQFRDTLAQNAALYLDLLLPQSVTAGRTARSRIHMISIESVENLAWELWFFRRARTGAETIGDSQFQGKWTFATGDAVRIGGAGLYYYYIDGLDIPYEVTDVLPDGQPDDADQRRFLHMALINRSAAGKSAGDAGAIRVQVHLEPTLGW